MSIVTCLSILLTPLTAGAQNPVTDALPEESIVWIKLDLKQENALQEFLVPKIAEGMSQGIRGGGMVTEEEPNKVLQNILQEIIQNDGISVAVKKGDYVKIKEGMEEIAIYIALQTTEDQWTELLKAARNYLVESEYKSRKIYHMGDAEVIFFTKIDSTILISQNKENIEKGIDEVVAGKNLSKNTKYQNTTAFFSAGGIINMFADGNEIGKMLEQFTEQEMTAGKGESEFPEETKKTIEEVIKMLKTNMGLGFSIGKTPTEFYARSVDLYNDAEREKSSFSRKDLTYTPTIYKKMPGENLIMYAEMSNFKKIWEMEKSLFTGNQEALEEFTMISKKVKTETGIDIEKDVLSILEGEIGFSFNQDMESVIPGITMLTDVSKNAAAAKTTVEKLKTLIEKKLQQHQNEIRMPYSIKEKSIRGGTGYMMTFQKPETKKRMSAVEEKQLEMMFPVNLYLGVTGDNMLYISSQKNFEQSYGTGIQEKELTEIQAKKYTSRFYLNFKNLTSYVKTIMELPYKALPKEDRKYFDNQEIMKKFETTMMPWKNVIAYGTTEPGKDESNLIIHADTDAINQEYFKKIGESSRKYSKNNSRYENYKNSQFEDVEEEAWYHNDVRESRIYGSVKGYDDGNFRPQNEITRAEFISMAMRTSYEDEEYAFYRLPENIKDVGYESWYKDAISQALAKGIIQASADGMIRPDEQINRAEAAKIIANILEKTGGIETNREESKKFSDVQENAWYADAVARNSSAGIIHGHSNGTFAPNDNLKRAEAAALMNRLRKVLK